jgi:hypothetical protein
MTSETDKEAYQHKYEELIREYKDQYYQYKRNKALILLDYNEKVKAERRGLSVGLSGDKKDKLKFKTAFKLFKLDYVGYVKEKHADLGFKERAEILKNLWKNLSPHSKFLYVKRSRLDKKRAMLDKTMETILHVQQEKDSNIKPKPAPTATTAQTKPSEELKGTVEIEKIQSDNKENVHDLGNTDKTESTKEEEIKMEIDYKKEFLSKEDPNDPDYKPDEEEEDETDSEEEPDDEIEQEELEALKSVEKIMEDNEKERAKVEAEVKAQLKLV